MWGQGKTGQQSSGQKCRHEKAACPLRAASGQFRVFARARLRESSRNRENKATNLLKTNEDAFRRGQDRAAREHDLGCPKPFWNAKRRRFLESTGNRENKATNLLKTNEGASCRVQDRAAREHDLGCPTPFWNAKHQRLLESTGNRENRATDLRSGGRRSCTDKKSFTPALHLLPRRLTFCFLGQPSCPE